MAHRRWRNREKRRRTGRGAMEDSEAVAALTQAHEAVRWPGGDSKAAAVEKLGGGGARAQRGEEESRDGYNEDRVRASAFYRGRREVAALGTQWPASIPVLEDTGYSE
jgi:hypothetical protein